MANSNAIATVTIQDQDLLTSTLANLVSRASVSATFPANNVVYSGYQTIASGSITLFSSGIGCPFMYFRNIGPTNAALLNFVLAASAVVDVLNLAPGGIFLFANGVTASSPANTQTNLTTFLFGPVSNSPITVEYLYAY